MVNCPYLGHSVQTYKVNRPNLGHFEQKRKPSSSEKAYDIASYVELYLGPCFIRRC